MDTQGYKANEVCTEPFALLLYWKLEKSYHLGLKRQKKKVARCLTALPILQSEAYNKPWENINPGMYTWKKNSVQIWLGEGHTVNTSIWDT